MEQMGVQAEERWERKPGEIQSPISSERLWLKERY